MRIPAAAIARIEGSSFDGIHLAWGVPPGAAYSLDGFDIQRRRATGEVQFECVTLAKAETHALHSEYEYDFPAGQIRVVRGAAKKTTPPGIDEASIGEDSPALARYGAAGTELDGESLAGWLYTVEFDHGCDELRLDVRQPESLVIGEYRRKAVDFHYVASSEAFHVRLSHGPFDRARIWTRSPLTWLRICCGKLGEETYCGWAKTPYLVKGYQIPIEELDGSLQSSADELARAATRLIGTETLGSSKLRRVADLLSDATAEAPEISPRVWRCQMRGENGAPAFDFSSWEFARTVGIDAKWRRILALGYLDEDCGLEEDQAYDYRISGRFRRADLEEDVVGFHQLPRGIELPRLFYHGPIRFRCSFPPAVAAVPEPSSSAPGTPFRTGLRLEGVLSVEFDRPIERLVLQLSRLTDDVVLQWATHDAYGVFTGQQAEQGTIEISERAKLEFQQPVSRLTLSGSAILFALRLVPDDLDYDPEEVVEVSTVVSRVVYQDSGAPEPPATVGTTNLQQPSQLDAEGPRSDTLGYRVSWLPQGPSGEAPPIWPEDVLSPPPQQAMAYEIERRRAGVSAGEWSKIDEDPTYYVGSRQDDSDEARTVHWGADLNALYPETRRGAGSTSWIAVEDTLNGRPTAGAIPPGSEHQYRVCSIDVTGRRSETATIGPVVRLEKHTPPPYVGTTPGDPEDARRPKGVRARVIQRSDADLPAADRELLAGADDAVVLEWGWGERQRRADPWATEFRVYAQSVPFDRLLGEITQVSSTTSGFEVEAKFDRDLDADALVGLWLPAGEHVYRILSHSAAVGGSTVTVDLAAPSTSSSTPQKGKIGLPWSPGSELSDPRAWEQRVAVVPIQQQTSYQAVIRDWLQPTPDQPSVPLWVGVSAADDESYVGDSVPPAALNGGRPGNEGPISGTSVTGRYRGRPELPPQPLPPVDELVSREPRADEVVVELDLDALLPDMAALGPTRVALEQTSVANLLSHVSVVDEKIVITAGGDGRLEYTLADPDDHATFVEQLVSGQPSRVDNRFLADLLARLDGLAPHEAWTPVPGGSLGWGQIQPGFPADPARYFLRVRLLDAAGHVSEGAAVLPNWEQRPATVAR